MASPGSSNTSFVCKLCNIQFTHYVQGARQHHSSSHLHKTRSNHVVARAKTILQVRQTVRSFPALIDQHLSSHGPWRAKLFELLGRALLEEDEQMVEQAHKDFVSFQQLEQISLLELAVWKFCCLTQTQNDTSGERKRTYLEWKWWDERGWKAHKQQHYRCNQVVILINTILPFLVDVQDPGIRSSTSSSDIIRGNSNVPKGGPPHTKRIMIPNNNKPKLDPAVAPLVSLHVPSENWHRCSRQRELPSGRVRTILTIRDEAETILSRMRHSVSPYHGSLWSKMYEVIVRALVEENRLWMEDSLIRNLAWYELLERISLFELAVWKFACVARENLCESVRLESQTWSYLEWKRWLETGWKHH